MTTEVYDRSRPAFHSGRPALIDDSAVFPAAMGSQVQDTVRHANPAAGSCSSGP